MAKPSTTCPGPLWLAVAMSLISGGNQESCPTWFDIGPENCPKSLLQLADGRSIILFSLGPLAAVQCLFMEPFPIAAKRLTALGKLPKRFWHARIRPHFCKPVLVPFHGISVQCLCLENVPFTVTLLLARWGSAASRPVQQSGATNCDSAYRWLMVFPYSWRFNGCRNLNPSPRPHNWPKRFFAARRGRSTDLNLGPLAVRAMSFYPRFKACRLRSPENCPNWLLQQSVRIEAWQQTLVPGSSFGLPCHVFLWKRIQGCQDSDSPSKTAQTLLTARQRPQQTCPDALWLPCNVNFSMEVLKASRLTALIKLPKR